MLGVGETFSLAGFNEAPAERGGKPGKPVHAGEWTEAFNEAPAERGGKPRCWPAAWAHVAELQ